MVTIFVHESQFISKLSKKESEKQDNCCFLTVQTQKVSGNPLAKTKIGLIKFGKSNKKLLISLIKCLL